MSQTETSVSPRAHRRPSAVILDRAQLEGFTVTNENRSLTDVALEMLVKAGWISTDQLPDKGM